MALASEEDQRADSEPVLLNLESGAYYRATGVTLRIWELLAEPCELEQVVAALASEFDVTEERLRSDVQDMLDQLLKEGLIAVAGEKDPR
jgi:hypothetical protein